MPVVPPSLPAVLHSLDRAVDAPRRPGVPTGTWRWQVRQRLAAVRDVLTGDAVGADENWLGARGGSAFAERNELMSRLAALGTTILEASDLDAARVEVKRAIADVHRHVQRPGTDGEG